MASMDERNCRRMNYILKLLGQIKSDKMVTKKEVSAIAKDKLSSISRIKFAFLTEPYFFNNSFQPRWVVNFQFFYKIIGSAIHQFFIG